MNMPVTGEEARGRPFDEGERRRWDIGSVQLQLGAGGRWTAARGAAARSKEEDDPRWAKLGRTAG
jgi:hypothetical protein